MATDRPTENNKLDGLTERPDNRTARMVDRTYTYKLMSDVYTSMFRLQCPADTRLPLRRPRTDHCEGKGFDAHVLSHRQRHQEHPP